MRLVILTFKAPRQNKVMPVISVDKAFDILALLLHMGFMRLLLMSLLHVFDVLRVKGGSRFFYISG